MMEHFSSLMNTFPIINCVHIHCNIMEVAEADSDADIRACVDLLAEHFHAEVHMPLQEWKAAELSKLTNKSHIGMCNQRLPCMTGPCVWLPILMYTSPSSTGVAKHKSKVVGVVVLRSSTSSQQPVLLSSGLCSYVQDTLILEDALEVALGWMYIRGAYTTHCPHTYHTLSITIMCTAQRIACRVHRGGCRGPG